MTRPTRAAPSARRAAIAALCIVSLLAVSGCGTEAPPSTGALSDASSLDAATADAGCQAHEGCPDAGDACTTGDTCKAGSCEAGTDTCLCKADSDCVSQEDSDLQDGGRHGVSEESVPAEDGAVPADAAAGRHPV